MRQPREDLQRLATYVISARISAGYQTRKEFAAAIGVTARTLGKLETGSERVSADTLVRVAKGVGWTPDSPMRILSGREPLEQGSAGEDPAGARLRQLLRDYGDDYVVQSLAARPGASAATRAAEIDEYVRIRGLAGWGNGTTGP